MDRGAANAAPLALSASCATVFLPVLTEQCVGAAFY